VYKQTLDGLRLLGRIDWVTEKLQEHRREKPVTIVVDGFTSRRQRWSGHGSKNNRHTGRQV
ncbi:MAG TPA: hypothetical protein VGP27_28370, partial [Mycobacterium sp.]|nr:hypothetical protein [Mycobacterium sp.]